MNNFFKFFIRYNIECGQKDLIIKKSELLNEKCVVVGAIAGIVAGIVGSIFGFIGEMIGLFPGPSNPVVATITFIILSIIFGAIFGMLYEKLYNSCPGEGIMKGINAGLIIWLVKDIAAGAFVGFVDGNIGIATSLIFVGFFMWIAYGALLGILYKK